MLAPRAQVKREAPDSPRTFRSTRDIVQKSLDCGKTDCCNRAYRLVRADIWFLLWLILTARTWFWLILLA